MKTIMFCLILSLTGIPAYAADWKWDTADVLRELVAEGVTVIDWGQTRDIRHHDGHYEMNPILGRTPSNESIGKYFGTILVLHPVISALLPKEADVFGWHTHPRSAWQYIYIGVESATVISNYRGGIRMSF
jgi:hypothetical protein